jgi:hypothetical protein
MRRALRSVILAWCLLACPFIPGGQASADAPPGSPGALPGLRLGVSERGMYRLTYEALVEAGVPSTGLDPMSLALWWRDQPISLDLIGAEDGVFGPGDMVAFYGEPYVGRYMTRNLYHLTWTGAGGTRMLTRDAAPQPGAFSSLVIHPRVRAEFSRVYYSAYKDLPRDADHLFDSPLYPNSARPTAAVTYTLDLPNLVWGDAQVRVAVHGGREIPHRNPDQSLRLLFNSVDIGTSAWDGSVTQIVSGSVPAAVLEQGSNTLTLEAALDQLPGIDYYWLSPDWAEVTYPARARAANDRLYIPAQFGHRIYLPVTIGVATGSSLNGRDTPGGFNLTASCFANAGVRVYDVSDPRRPVLLTGARESITAQRCPFFSHEVDFAALPGASYMLASPGGFLSPSSIEYDAGSDLRTVERPADYIAIVHRSLWDAIQPLLDHRGTEGLAVAKVDVQDIYDEFSGGMVEPEAIRSFLSLAYRHWNAGGVPPQYVLLVGDGHYDFKGELRPGASLLIPPYLLDVDPSIGETAVDNRYASVDGDADFLPNMALGRIPARTPAEVAAVVDKILAYEKGGPTGDWQRRVVFVADRQDDPSGNFHALSDRARNLLPVGYESQVIYYKSMSALDSQAEMKATLRTAFDGGALYAQWFGHAAKASWSKDRVWELNDPLKLAANNVWPFTAHYSCWSGYFINLTPSAQYGNSDQSLGEALLLAPMRGSLADFSPSGLHIGSALEGLNQALLKAIFVDRIDRVGKATDAARKAYFESNAGPLDVIDTQVLLGDPATRLKLP